MTLIEAIAEIVSERGYLVISELSPLRVGHRFSIICELKQPFVIVAETTVEEALIQREMVTQKTGMAFDGDCLGRRYHYRVTTD